MKPTIEEFHDITAYPVSSIRKDHKSRPVIDAGLCAADGTALKSALHFRDYQYNVPSPSDTGDPDVVKEPVMFGGFHFFPNFNHTIAESLGRLWADQRLSGKVAKIAFLAGTPKAATVTTPEFFRELFRLLRIEAEPVVISRPTTFRKILVPSQLYGLGPFMPPHDELVSFFRGRLRITKADVNPQKKIFVTRARWPLSKGGIVLESRLADALHENGFVIMSPERVSIEEQFREYSTAGHLLFSEGSALHLFALIANPGQKVAVLMRRPWPRYVSRYVPHILGVRDPYQVNAVREIILPANSEHPYVNAASVVDFEKIIADLVGVGFLGGTIEFDRPGKKEVDRELSLHGFSKTSHMRRLKTSLSFWLSSSPARRRLKNWFDRPLSVLRRR